MSSWRKHSKRHLIWYKMPSFSLISCCSLCAGAVSDVGREVEVDHNMSTTRTILDFGVDPTFLHKDADRSIPLHIAVQNTNTALVGVLIPTSAVTAS